MIETRPKFPRSEIGRGFPEEEIAAAEVQWEEELDELEARGAIRFEFPEDRGYGYLTFGPMDGASITEVMRGAIEVSTYEALYMSEGFGLSEETLRNNPFEYVSDLSLKGVSDAHVKALCSRGVKSIDVSGGVEPMSREDISEEDLSDEERKGLAEFEGYLTEWTTAAQGCATILTDACLEYIPSNCEIVRLRDTNITDAALAQFISRAENLIVLSVQSSQLTGEFISALAKHQGLLQIDCESPLLTGENVVANLPQLPALEAISLVGERILEGFDGAAVAGRAPVLEVVNVNPATLEKADLYRTALQLPGIEINGVQLSERAVKKAAKKLGIEL